ncbi:nuclear transport factor 2 family protein [bacterium]|nr:nuclear transport factor 2 family protein [bacterium]
MKRFLTAAVICACAGALSAQSATDAGSPPAEKAIIQAAMDYMEGGDFGDTERMAKALHYELTKVSPVTLPQTGKTVLNTMGYTYLLEVTRPAAANPPAESKARAGILAVREGMAMVKAESDKYYDYLQMAEIDGEWKIINVLWIMHPDFRKDPAAEPVDIAADTAAVRAACLDYIEGSFSGDAARMERALHPELMKVIQMVHPQTGRTMLNKMGSGMLIAGTEAKMGMVEEGKRALSFRLLDLQRNIAFAEVLSSRYYDYCQLAKVNGEWKIVNVLWKMNPEAAARAR